MAPQPPTDVSGGKPWIDSNLKDNIKPGMKTSPKDDLYQARLACASSVLTRTGMSEAEAKAAFENRVELEKRIIQEAASTAQGNEATSGSTSSGAKSDKNLRLKPEELDGFASPFPLKALAEAQGYGADREYLVEAGNEAEIRAACALFTQDNIALVRDYILVGYALEASGWLDSQAFDAWRQDRLLRPVRRLQRDCRGIGVRPCMPRPADAGRPRLRRVVRS